jgi:isocitrate dehydrogenase
LGKKPTKIQAVNYAESLTGNEKDTKFPSGFAQWRPSTSPPHLAKKEIVGVDVFLHWNGKPEDLGIKMQKLNADGMELSLITNRGVKVWPGGFPETFCTDHWRCRYQV